MDGRSSRFIPLGVSAVFIILVVQNVDHEECKRVQGSNKLQNSNATSCALNTLIYTCLEQKVWFKTEGLEGV